MPYSLIFDIGKTNKKAFLFDENYQEVYKTIIYFEEDKDGDGFPCDNLSAIEEWINETIEHVFNKYGDDINAINFSAYGASFVHVDKNGKTLVPLYNYLKPLPIDILQSFYEKYGNKYKIARETASPPLAMLNAGLQLYWLKYAHPEVFKNIKWSLHFSQYLSYLLTGIPFSDYTSIGCHTALWDFSKNDYHDWVYKEKIGQILPPIAPTNSSISKVILGKKIKIGIGIHDSSSALLPYLRTEEKPFLLISTGTWSISLNPFNKELLTDGALEKDCLNYMQIDGNPVKAARLFLGEEYEFQAKKLELFYEKEKSAHRSIQFDETIFRQVLNANRHCFVLKYITPHWRLPKSDQWQDINSFEMAYHQLVWELVQLQIEAIKLAIGKSSIKKIYIDGGFADNEVYVKMLASHFKEMKLRTTQSPLGSALGAAMVISENTVRKDFLEKNYGLKKVSHL
ncbi:MAG: carbohydrate kinase [Bacteroidetes bacterium]|nr:carbohydrate kinase [Bacteroidota bacterium]